MSMHFSFESGPGKQRPTERPDPTAPFRILVLGDFSGRASRAEPGDPASRPRRLADLDTIEELPAEFDAKVRTAAGIEIEIEELDHLHPDELYRRVEVFAALRALRKRLNDPTTFPEAAKEVMAMQGNAPDAPSDERNTAARADDFASLLSSGFGQGGSTTSPAVDALVRQAMAPHIVPGTDPRQPEMLATVDKAIGAQMRAILHDADWTRFETAWLGLKRLITHIELDETLSVTAADCSLADLATDTDGRSTDTLLDAPARGEEPFALIVALARFDASDTSIRTLRNLAKAAERHGSVLIAGAHDRLLGVESLAEKPDARDWPEEVIGDAAAWADFRKSPEAASVVLVAPRTLARLPYGKRTDEIDSFPFEEIENASVPRAHEQHTWGHSAVLVAEALANAFLAEGWSSRPEGAADLDDLPVRVLPDGSMLPCAEIWLPEPAIPAVHTRGLTPAQSIRSRGAIRLGPIRALAGTEVRCRW